MARVVFLAAGYHGDVMPLVGAANRLVERGHDVTFVTPTGFHPFLAGEPFALAPYPLDFSTAAMHADPEHGRLMRRPWLNLPRLARYWMRRMLIAAPEAVRSALTEAFGGASVVVSQAMMGVVAVPVARSLGVPVVTGHVVPHAVAATAESWTRLARSSLVGLARAAGWMAFAVGASPVLYDREVNAWRRDLGLKPMRVGVLMSWMEADHTVVLGSRHYLRKAVPDWPLVTWGGFSHWLPAAGQPADAAVHAFLDAGDAPVLVTLGTSGATGAGRRFATIARGLDELGLRSLLLVGNRDNLAAVGDRPGAFEFALLGDVLPRCRVAVVSGALGTLAAAFAAGVPVVVLPHIPDQLANGYEAQKLGVGVLVRHPRQVARAVARIEADPGYRRRVAGLAARLRTEDGAAALADVAESAMRRPPRPGVSRPRRTLPGARAATGMG